MGVNGKKKELWETIPGYSRYIISTKGRVKSFNIEGNPKILKGSLHKSTGYWRVSLIGDNGIRKSKCIHTLMGITFLGYIPNGKYKLVVDHKDNNPLNNQLNNLQIISHRINSSKDRNHTSKYIGVSWYKKSNKWLAKIRHKGKCTRLGKYDTEEEASNAYQVALKLLNNEC